MQQSTHFFLQREEFEEFVADLITLSKLRKIEKEVRLNYNKLSKIMALNIDITETLLYQEGELKGQLKEKLAVATTMLIDNMPIEQVAKFTKLSIDEVKAIENNCNCLAP